MITIILIICLSLLGLFYWSKWYFYINIDTGDILEYVKINESDQSKHIVQLYVLDKHNCRISYNRRDIVYYKNIYRQPESYEIKQLNDYWFIIFLQSILTYKSDFYIYKKILDYIKTVIKSQRVFDSAEWDIRGLYYDDYTGPGIIAREIVWKLSELITLKFDNNEKGPL